MNSNDVSTKRWIYLDTTKIIAVFFIVVMHVSSGAWGTAQIGTFDWHVLNVFNALSRFCIPLFFMQIGALFLNDSIDLPIKKLYRKYILHLVTAFLFWSVINMVIYYIYDAPNGFADFTIASFLVGVLEGAPYVHWFIFVAISMYIIIPILRALAKDIRVCGYFLILWAIFSIVLPLVQQLQWIFPGMPEGAKEVLTQVTNATDRIKPGMVVDYVGYLVLGHYIHVKVFSRKTANGLIGVGVLGFLLTVVITALLSMRNGTVSEAFVGFFAPNVCMMAIGVMVGAKTYLERTWFRDRTYNGIRFFSSVSFGIFLVHDVFRMLLARNGIHTMIFMPILSVPVFSLGIFVISGLIAYALKKIPVVGKYII